MSDDPMLGGDRKAAPHQDVVSALSALGIMQIDFGLEYTRNHPKTAHCRFCRHPWFVIWDAARGCYHLVDAAHDEACPVVVLRKLVEDKP